MAETSTPVQNAFNRQIFEHAINIERFQAGQVREARAFLNDLMDNIIQQVVKIDPTAPARTRFQQERLEKLGKVVGQLITESYGDMQTWMEADLFQAGNIEQDFIVRAINKTVFAGAKMLQPTLTTQQMRTLVENRKVMATPARDWWREGGKGRDVAFKRTMNVLVAQGATNQQITREIRRKGGWEDKTRKQVEALVRTEVASIMNTARGEVYRENADIIQALEHNSVLDEKTTNICVARDGLKWSFPELKGLDHNVDYEDPPLHFQCRSVIISVLEDYATIFGSKSRYTIDQFEKRLRENIPQREKESAEKYEERIGRIVDNQRERMTTKTESNQRSMTEFIKADRARAEKMLGKTAAELFFAGRMNLKDLITAQGNRPLTAAELKAKYGD